MIRYDHLKNVSTNQNVSEIHFPGLVISGLRGGSGKTVFSIGITAAFVELGLLVTPFKKGPDYIDAGWLALAAGRPCHNLDTFLMKPEVVASSYRSYARFADVSVIEGNRGLHDCIDVKGSTSTAELAKLLNLPVVLCVDVTKTTRTMAAIISGVSGFDSDVNICGIILNRVAGTRHKKILIRSINEYCGLPILGAFPKLTDEFFPERHMGLVPTPDHNWANSSIETIRDITKRYINIPALLEATGYIILEKDPTCCSNKKSHFVSSRGSSLIEKTATGNKIDKPIIGIMQDSAFQFYYPENFKALIKAGAHLTFISPIDSVVIPEIDALYIGGGFPETHAKNLEKNVFMRETVNFFAETCMPIYAECGGLVYLGEKLIVGNKTFEMSGILPATFKIWNKPQGHGYTKLKVEKNNPYYEMGLELLGHEFHYSSVYDWKGEDDCLIFSVIRGVGFAHGRDGILYKNVLGTYTHIHALGITAWATGLVNVATEYMNSK